MDLGLLNQLRNGALFMQKVKAYAQLNARAKVQIKGERPLTDEVVLQVKGREEFPSRQTYRAYVRAWAKQRVRFAKAYERGDLVPHLRSVVEQGL